jgi:hypothetical protein
MFNQLDDLDFGNDVSFIHWCFLGWEYFWNARPIYSFVLPLYWEFFLLCF